MAQSRAKGKRGELEFAAFARECGFPDAARGQQHKGGADSPDVRGIPGIHPEVKFCARVDIYEALNQAVRDADVLTNVPVVFHRRVSRTDTGRRWVAVLDAEWFLSLWKDRLATADTVRSTLTQIEALLGERGIPL